MKKKRVVIEKLADQTWVYYKSFEFDECWKDAVKEVFELNSQSLNKYRAVLVCESLTHIYCSCFYIIPTCKNV